MSNVTGARARDGCRRRVGPGPDLEVRVLLSHLLPVIPAAPRPAYRSHVNPSCLGTRSAADQGGVGAAQRGSAPAQTVLGRTTQAALRVLATSANSRWLIEAHGSHCVH